MFLCVAVPRAFTTAVCHVPHHRGCRIGTMVTHSALCYGVCYDEEEAFWRPVVKDNDHFPGLPVLLRCALVQQ